MFYLRDLQHKLQEKGYYSGVVDNLYGPLTSKAVEAWGRSGTDLDAKKPITPVGNVIPVSWLPRCIMQRIIIHWTAGGPDCSAIDREHYHFIIDQALKIHKGDHSVADNVNTSDGDYAAHVRNLNRGSIGIALCGMLNAVERPFDPGPYPINKGQWELAAKAVAELAKFYSISVKPTTILQHGEVQQNLGVTQLGKWDIMKLPWDIPANSGAQFRELVLDNV